MKPDSFTGKIRISGNSKVITIPKPFRELYEDGEMVDITISKRAS